MWKIKLKCFFVRVKTELDGFFCKYSHIFTLLRHNEQWQLLNIYICNICIIISIYHSVFFSLIYQRNWDYLGSIQHTKQCFHNKLNYSSFYLLFASVYQQMCVEDWPLWLSVLFIMEIFSDGKQTDQIWEFLLLDVWTVSVFVT